MSVLALVNPIANVGALWGAGYTMFKHRGLVSAMTGRELTDRYAGQVLGAAWAFIAPMLTMTVYIVVFTFIFKGRLGEIENPAAFTAYALAGLAPWLTMSDVLGRSVMVVVGNANLVKQIVFPVEVLPMKVVFATLPTLGIGLTAAVISAAISGVLDWERLGIYLPAALGSYLLFIAGLAYLVSSFGVFLRDLKDIINFVLGIGLFLNPIIFPPGGAPDWLQASFIYNPISNMFFCFHYAVVGGVDPPNYAWTIFPIFAVVVFMLGWRAFRFLKPAFGNVL
jgi:lipopolysaccharide transport system permease protein